MGTSPGRKGNSNAIGLSCFYRLKIVVATLQIQILGDDGDIIEIRHAIAQQLKHRHFWYQQCHETDLEHSANKIRLLDSVGLLSFLLTLGPVILTVILLFFTVISVPLGNTFFFRPVSITSSKLPAVFDPNT